MSNLALMDEMTLVKACLNGDISSQKHLYNRYASKMMGVCWRFAKTKSEAEDLLQDGFLKVFSDLSQFRGKGSLEGWVRQVIVNTALQHVRRKKLVFEPMLEIERETKSNRSYEQVYLNFEVQDLMNMLHSLPSGVRTIFNLYVFEDFSHKEIANELNISVGTSKSQLFKARRILKTKFQNLNSFKLLANDK